MIRDIAPDDPTDAGVIKDHQQREDGGIGDSSLEPGGIPGRND